MARHEINPMTAATATALARSYLAENVPTYPPGTDLPAFRRALEIVLADGQLVRQYLHVLNEELDRTTPGGELFDETEMDRFAAEGLSWVPTDRLALLAIDRGAVSAMHDLVVELWSDYWWRRAIDAEQERGTWAQTSGLLTRLAARRKAGPILQTSRPEQEKVDAPPAYLLAAEDRPAETAPSSGIPADRVVSVPAGQTIWRAGSPIPLTVVVTPATEAPGYLSVKLSPLSLHGEVRCHGWLADAGLAVWRGTRGRSTLEFALPPASESRYFVAEYRSEKRDVFFVAALDGSSVSAELAARLFAVAAADLAPDEPARAAELVAPHS